jgi:hydroxymethylpyrimidine pyrophosphatase-like HAD family hydrolase
MSLPRLVATDLDGTLLRSDGSVSRRTASVLSGVLDRGIEVVFVTARPKRWMTQLWPYVGSRGLAVVSNGALLLDVATGDSLEVHGIDPAPGLALASAIREAVPGSEFAVETLAGIALDPSYDEPDHAPPDSPRGDLSVVWTEPALKLLVRHRTMDPAGFRAAVAHVVGDSATPTWTVDGLVEISATDVTKGAALARLCELRGVGPAEVLAFGDMPNDLPMLGWAGTSYAVANAHPSVLAAADHVAPANDDDGVAAVLARTFGL